MIRRDRVREQLLDFLRDQQVGAHARVIVTLTHDQSFAGVAKKHREQVQVWHSFLAPRFVDSLMHDTKLDLPLIQSDQPRKCYGRQGFAVSPNRLVDAAEQLALPLPRAIRVGIFDKREIGGEGGRFLALGPAIEEGIDGEAVVYEKS